MIMLLKKNKWRTFIYFGIKYAEVIKSHSYTAAQIIREAGIKKSFSAELSKGIRLSKFVIIKKEFDS